jgi:hypothetical protein
MPEKKASEVVVNKRVESNKAKAKAKADISNRPTVTKNKMKDKGIAIPNIRVRKGKVKELKKKVPQTAIIHETTLKRKVSSSSSS